MGSVLSGIRSPVRRIADRHPRLRGPIGRCWNTFERARFTFHARRNRRRNADEAAAVDPYRLLDLSPQFVEGHSSGRFDSIADAGRVVDGDWDREGPVTFESRVRYPSFREHFLEGVPWEETAFYRSKIEKIRSDRPAKYASVDALDRKCGELDRIYEELRTSGYRTQAEIATAAGSSGTIVGDGGRGVLPWGSKHLVRSEVAVDVARDGEPMLNEGRHRMCLAKLLALDSIPVRVVVRHREWQDRRNEVADALRNTSPDSRAAAIETVEDHLPDDDSIVVGPTHPDLLAIVDDYLEGQ